LEQAQLWEQFPNVIPLPTAQPTAPSNPRNEVWDALEEILGYTPRTRTEKAAFGKVVRSFNEAEATPEEMRDAAKEYGKAWPHCELTIWSFEKWFGHFLSKVEKRSSAKVTVCADCGISQGAGHAADCPQVP
jgi:hypothetical protein